MFLSGSDKDVSTTYDNKINNKQIKSTEYVTEASFDKFIKQISSNKIIMGKRKATNDVMK